MAGRSHLRVTAQRTEARGTGLVCLALNSPLALPQLTIARRFPNIILRVILKIHRSHVTQSGSVSGAAVPCRVVRLHMAAPSCSEQYSLWPLPSALHPVSGHSPKCPPPSLWQMCHLLYFYFLFLRIFTVSRTFFSFFFFLKFVF